MTTFDLVPKVLPEVVPAFKLLFNWSGKLTGKLIILIISAKSQVSRIHQLLWGHLGMLDMGAIWVNPKGKLWFFFFFPSWKWDALQEEAITLVKLGGMLIKTIQWDKAMVFKPFYVKGLPRKLVKRLISSLLLSESRWSSGVWILTSV